MASWTELTNRFNLAKTGQKQLDSIKSHIKEYFIVGKSSAINLRLDIEDEATLTAESDVTDHYVESNEAYQDQISLKPKIYTINGEVGELVWYQKDSASQIAGQVAQRLEGVISFLPIRSRGFNQMKNTVMKAAQWADTASNALSKVSNLWNAATGSVSHQEQAYQELLRYRDNREPVDIETPWGRLNSYVITSIKLTQPKETKDKSLISIVFKQFQTTRVTTVDFDSSKYQANALYENQPTVDNGKTAGEDVSYGETESTPEGDMTYCQVISEGKDYEVTWTEKDEMFTIVNSETGEPVTDSVEWSDALGNAYEQCVSLRDRAEESFK